jgi:acyl carrier protein
MQTVEERVKAVTARVLRVDAKGLKPEDRFTADLGAESIQSVELMANFEEEFGIEMDEDSALSVQTIGDAAKFITEVCKQQGVQV